jgi:hypothetical protein
MIGLPNLQAMDRAQGARIWIASDRHAQWVRSPGRVRAVIGENPQIKVDAKAETAIEKGFAGPGLLLPNLALTSVSA